ncbi:spherulation-specific family 4 protein [Streptomyces sp. NPDC058045]|uniref:spherulation-specific family 4 protein n=1 Tax=Streptomyces sp. NPDC058045 TaxID=3346311 RepID=UPI0036E98039
MSHLTCSTQSGAGTSTGLGIGVPGLAHPLLAPAEWAGLTRPHTPLHWVALDVSGGPGSRPDPRCLDASGRLTQSGATVLGRLELRYGTRDFGELVSDAHRYLDWYRVGGFLLDRCPTERIDLPQVRRITSTLRAMLPGAHLVLGHGGHPYPGYAETGDQLITFAGPWSEYRWSQVPQWTADYPAARFCHLVHGVPRSHLEEALRIARWQGASTIWFTDRTDPGCGAGAWEGMPGYWDEIVSRIGPRVSE